MSLISFFDEPALYVRPSWQRQAAGRHASAYNAYRALQAQQAQLLSAFSDVFDNLTSGIQARTPKTELREVANGYVLEAELPGVRKEDLDVTIGEGGKTIRIEGRVGGRAQPDGATPSQPAPEAEARAAEPVQASEPAPTDDGTTTGTDNTAAPAAKESTSTEVAEKSTSDVTQSTQSDYTSTFSQTFTLPRAVDGTRVVARLEHGVLTLGIPFLEDTESVKVTVD